MILILLLNLNSHIPYFTTNSVTYFTIKRSHFSILYAFHFCNVLCTFAPCRAIEVEAETVEVTSKHLCVTCGNFYRQSNHCMHAYGRAVCFLVTIIPLTGFPFTLVKKRNSSPFHLQILKVPNGVQASNGVRCLLHCPKKVTPRFFKIQVEQAMSLFFEGVYYYIVLP